jgi:hypothetical protein
MADFSGMQDEELRNRVATILTDLDKLLRDVGPTLARIGHLRLEAGLIVQELRRRGVPVDSGKDGGQVP